MSILYVITTTKGNPSVDHWPPQIKESQWLVNLRKKTILGREDNPVSDTSPQDRILWFSSVDDFKNWINDNKLTDPTLISVLNEWNSTYNITRTERYFEIPETTISDVSSLFG
jgi:hypothetical protein